MITAGRTGPRFACSAGAERMDVVPSGRRPPAGKPGTAGGLTRNAGAGEAVPARIWREGAELGSGLTRLGAARGFRGFPIEPQSLDIDRAQNVAAAREYPRHTGWRLGIGGGRRDRLAQAGEEAWPV